MSFDLKIKLPKGFQPPVAPVAMPALERDKDRSEEEDRLWQQKKHEQALRRAHESAWAPFSRSLPVRTMSFVLEALRRSGALMPEGTLDQQKFASNDGQLLSPAECSSLAERLEHWLKEGEVFQVRGITHDLTPAAKGKEDLANRKRLVDLAAFFARAAQYGGVEVW